MFALLTALLIGLAFGTVQGFLIAYLDIQPFIITLAGMFFARGMITIVSVDPQKAPQNLMDILQTPINIPWLGSLNNRGVRIPAKMEFGVVIALVIVVLVYFLLRRHRLGRSFYAVGGNRQSALFGVLTLSTIKSIVTTSGLRDPWWQSITTGAMLCLFILLQSVVLMRRNRAKDKKKDK